MKIPKRYTLKMILLGLNASGKNLSVREAAGDWLLVGRGD
jgi:hypothetical protein